MYSDFEWKGAPLSSLTCPVITGLMYLVAVFLLLRLVPEDGLQFPLKMVFLFHNIFLSGLSIALCGGCLWESGVRAWSEGAADWMLCEDPHGTASGPLYFWSYAFYVSKYYELLDTFLAILHGSRPRHFFLHVYHHALVPVVMWSWLEYRMSLQFIGVILNTLVHVVMYAFFALKVLKISTPWKRLVTLLQITQFLFMTPCGVAVVVKEWMGCTCSGWWAMLVREDLRSSGEALARETKQQCRGWVDAALGKLESLAIRSREQLATLSAELPLTVKRLVGEEMARLRKVPTVTATQPQLRKASKHGTAASRSTPETQPFELGEPLPSKACSFRLDTDGRSGQAATLPLHAPADAVISGTPQALEDSC